MSNHAQAQRPQIAVIAAAGSASRMWPASKIIPKELFPLGKVPALEVGGGVLYDSRVIVQWIERQRPTPVLIPGIEALRWEALCDGVCDALVAVVLEKRRDPAAQWAPSLQAQEAKVHRGLARIEADLGALDGAFTLANAAAVAALGYVRLRAPPWLPERLGAWLDTASARASVRETAPPAA